MALTKVEGIFRVQNIYPQIPPIYHLLAKGTIAHHFISMLGYHLYCGITLAFLETGDVGIISTILAEPTTGCDNVEDCNDDVRILPLRYPTNATVSAIDGKETTDEIPLQLHTQGM